MKRKKGYRSVALVLVLFMVITAVMMQTECEVYAATPVSSHGRLSVKGADLVDKNKKKFQLRGISTHGINWDVGSPYVNKAAFKTLRNDWGANAVRLAMYTSEYNGYCSGGSKSALRNQIYKGVQYATDLGMYVIIDWHILNDGNPKSHLKEAKSFFKTMAKKYKKQKNEHGEIVDRTPTAKSDERTMKIAEVILSGIEDKGYCTEKEVIVVLGDQYKYAVTEMQIKRCLGEILDIYDLQKVKTNKALKEQYHIVSEGYPYIIINNTDI